MCYELKKDSGGKFRFNLKAGNGEIILSSQSYNEKADALAAIASVRAIGTNEVNFDRKTSVANEPFFVLKALNGQIIGRSEMYSSLYARDKGIASVRNNCTSTTVNDLAP